MLSVIKSVKPNASVSQAYKLNTKDQQRRDFIAAVKLLLWIFPSFIWNTFPMCIQ